MARCDQGYLCRVCGEEVEDLIDSDLYLRYIMGWVDPETLHTTPSATCVATLICLSSSTTRDSNPRYGRRGMEQAVSRQGFCSRTNATGVRCLCQTMGDL